jgi:hypothetical protein
MTTLMVICVIANVAQALIYKHLTGERQTAFWVLAVFCGVLVFI